MCTVVPLYSLIQYLWFQLFAVYRSLKKIKKNQETVHKFKNVRHARTVRNMVNPAAQMRPVLLSSSFAPIPMLPRRTCLHSASSILSVHIIAGSLQCLCSESPNLSIKFYHIYICYTNVMLYIVFGIIRNFT
jgi:hypothetical protein